MLPTALNVDDKSTWSDELCSWVKRYAERVRGTSESAWDAFEFEDEFRQVIADTPLRAYHSTRLLTHEVDWIREGGLAVATRALLDKKINAAAEHGYLSDDIRDALLGGRRLENDLAALGDRIALFVGRQVLNTGHGDDQLCTWGGEAMYLSAPGLLNKPLLQNLGNPTVIAANLDVARIRCAWPPLLKLFARAVLGLNVGVDAESFFSVVDYLAAIPPQAVDVWPQGHPEYDRHEHLRNLDCN